MCYFHYVYKTILSGNALLRLDYDSFCFANNCNCYFL